MKDSDYTDLTEYANLDGTEIGSYVSRLLELREFSESHGMSFEFSENLNAELEHWLSRFRNETEIEETTWQPPEIKGKELIWLKDTYDTI